MSTSLIVAGIGTEVGKTVASAVLVEALQADYWKPIQSGYPPDSDTTTVRNLISNSRSQFHPETYLLREPLSPHAAAAAESITIDPARIMPPKTKNSLIVELAGGLMVPLTDTYLNIDLVEKLGWSLVLVTRNYLGSINHTLLSVEALRRRNIPITGLIINGPSVAATESVILSYTGLPCLVRIADEPMIDRDIVKRYADRVRL